MKFSKPNKLFIIQFIFFNSLLSGAAQSPRRSIVRRSAASASASLFPSSRSAQASAKRTASGQTARQTGQSPLTSSGQGLGKKIWRARSRLCRNESLQVNMRLTAFFKLYKMCTLLHRCNLKIFAKNRFEKSAIFVKIQQKFCKCRKFCKFLPNFKKIS